MSMFSRQLFKAIQSVTGRWMATLRVALSFVSSAKEKKKKKKKDCYPPLSDLPEVSRPMRGGVLLGVGERTGSVAFSHALLSAETLVYYVRIPKSPPHI